MSILIIPARTGRSVVWLGATISIALALTIAGGSRANAAGLPGGADYLGSAASYAVLGAATVTNTGPSVVNGDLGVHPGTEVTGFGTPGGGTVNGDTHAADENSLAARNELTAAFTAAAGLTPDPQDLGTGDLTGSSFTAGVYSSASSLLIDGVITLVGDADDVFVFQAGSTLTMGVGSTIALSGEVQSCNVYWQIGSSATLNATTTFVGTIMASESISVLNAATIDGRLLAGAGAPTGAVTLINDTVTVPICDETAGDGEDGISDVEGPGTGPGTGPGDGPGEGPGSGPGDTPGSGAGDAPGGEAGSIDELAATGVNPLGILLASTLLIGLGIFGFTLPNRRNRGHHSTSR